MPNHRCWDCGSITGHSLVGDPTVAGAESNFGAVGQPVYFCAFQCMVCHAISIGIISPTREQMRWGGSVLDYLEAADGDEFGWKPSAGESRAYLDVPPQVGSAATEAYECASLKHNRSAVLLARSVVEATAKDKGITKGTLHDKIEALATQGLIRANIKDAAHSVREFGNDMAHGDFVTPIDDEETNLVIELMGEILNDVYQSPAKIQRAQTAAQARKQPQASATQPGTTGQQASGGQT